MASAHSSRRALRRHHRDRLKKARAHYWGGPHPEFGPTWEARRQGLLVQTPKPCACSMCANPRRLGNAALARTVQEHRAEQAARAAMVDALQLAHSLR